MDANNNLSQEDNFEYLTKENVEAEVARMKLIEANYDSDDETRVCNFPISASRYK
jgi:hypothetical protein